MTSSLESTLTRYRNRLLAAAALAVTSAAAAFSVAVAPAAAAETTSAGPSTTISADAGGIPVLVCVDGHCVIAPEGVHGWD